MVRDKTCLWIAEPPEAPLERHERRRKRPHWLSNTVDPHHITTMKGLPPEPSRSGPEMSGGAESEGRAAVANTFVGPGVAPKTSLSLPAVLGGKVFCLFGDVGWSLRSFAVSFTP
jgi:hypothetical protein